MSISDTRDELRDIYARLGRILASLDGQPSREQPRIGYQPGDRFDPTRKDHLMAAEAIFNRLGINEKDRAWYYNKRFHGIKRGDLEAVIESEHQEHCRRFPGVAKDRERRAREARRA